MAIANPAWGRPRIHEELLKIGIKISERTVARLMPKDRNPPSQTWRTFLDNHVEDWVSIDFFVVPSATFRVLFDLVVLAHCRVLHFNVTEHPAARWTGQQIIQAFPDGSGPRYLIRDRGRICGAEFADLRYVARSLYPDKELKWQSIVSMPPGFNFTRFRILARHTWWMFPLRF